MDERTIVVKQGGGFGTFVRGVLIGAALAYLFAPRSGKESRQILSEKGMEFRDKATDIARETRTKAEDAYLDVRSSAETLIKDTRNKVSDRVQGVKEGLVQGASETEKDLKRELEITEDINNRHYPL